jgi:aspartyl-tRNA synthetase
MRILSKEIIDYKDKEIEMSGWVASRRDHGKIIFIDLRDRTGITQIVFTPKDEKLYDLADTLRPEWVINIKGEVKKRPEGMKNPDLPNGDYEVNVSELNILTRAETPPISIDDDGWNINENNRMRYRYLDLRRKRVSENIKKRAESVKFIRNFLFDHDFVEVETPVLGKSTPEGARDYLIPARLHPGEFYALPQSPQQYKQLLMVAGLERYCQIVKCFRDEDTRGDRQPEFTQIDIELSFTNEEEVLSLVEKMMISFVKEVYPEKELTLDENGRIPRISYEKAMKEYNSDRPDVRKNKENKNELAFVFVTDFPAFEKKEGKGRWGAVHHPFTMPNIEDPEELKDKFKEDPSSIKARQYDLVLNGYEIAGGSIRIHNPELLSAIFEVLGHKKEDIDIRFGHLLEAFKYGVPPHGGIAFGFDRVVMILQNEPNIREVIAFPKTGDGRDLMMNAPSKVDKDQLEDLHIKIDIKK